MSNEQQPTGGSGKNRRASDDDLSTEHTWHRASSAPGADRRFQNDAPPPRFASEMQPSQSQQNRFQGVPSERAAASLSQTVPAPDWMNGPQPPMERAPKKRGPLRRGVSFVVSLILTGLLLVVLSKALFISPILARFPIEKDCTVDNKHIEVIFGNDAAGSHTTYRYWVDTRECGRLEIPSIWTYGVWKSDEIFKKVRRGHTYRMALFNGDPLSVLPDATTIAWIRDDANGGRYL